MTIFALKLEQQSDGCYDFVVAENGGLTVDRSFDTNIITSLFTDTRADETEIPRPELRRGFWAYDEIGSKLWLLQRRTQENLNRAIDFCRLSLQWMIDEKIVVSIRVSGTMIANGFGITITFVRFDNQIETRYYEAWTNSEFN